MQRGRPKTKLVLSKPERAALEKIARLPTHPQAALRARLILDCARGLDNQTVGSLNQVTPLTVGKWRKRFLARRIPGLDATVPGQENGLPRRPEPAKPLAAEKEELAGLQKRVTLQDLADHLNLHLSTVSLGLKNDPRLLPATRLRIQETARRMQYCPDPMAKALAVYRQAIRPVSQHGSLALLAHQEDQVKTFMEVISQRAARFGYKIEFVDCFSTSRSKERLTRLLRSRGMQGLLVLPPAFGRKNPRRLRLDWQYFPAVVLGHALYHPVLHQVNNDHLGNAQLLIRKLLSLGYRRIGLCVNEQYAFLHAGGGWEGGYWIEMRRQADVPKPFYHRTFELDMPTVSAMKKWIQHERLDAVILDTEATALTLAPHLREFGPALGIACLVCYHHHFSGIEPNYSRVWSAAVDFLVHLIHTHQRGIPDIPQRVLLRGDWIEGDTLRRMNSPRVSSRRKPPGDAGESFA